MTRVVRCRRQDGAVIVTVALTLLFLMGFMGVALDFGRLFVVKSELQTAMDSCALAAAGELNRQEDALDRATRAGMTAGNLNRVDFQSSIWQGGGQIVPANITFKDGSYNDTVVPADAEYAQCQHTQEGIRMWLMQALGVFSGNTAATPATQNVFALAVATRASAQDVCFVVPAAIKRRPGGAPPNYGFVAGEWLTLLTTQSADPGGDIGWANLDGSQSAAQTVAQMEGINCNTAEVGETIGTSGVQANVAPVWNRRFGIYKNTDDPNVYPPDLTGYAYTTANWPSGQNAFDGPVPAGAHVTADNFLNKRLSFASCADTGTRVQGANSCESITGLSLASFQKLAAPGNVEGGHMQYGSDRRLAAIPILDDARHVIDYACIFLLQPLSMPMASVQVEFRGNAGDPDSPCTASGLPGGSAGPLVPVLVQ